ncbi:malonate--CoA ligase [Sulfitobacter sp.]|uniref:malonate--CoA ligase n=1 Tax=Sulfitobacter sp. TaxID=1903071 RepID=UPI003002E043
MTNPLFDTLLAPHLGSDAPFVIHPDGTTQTYGAFMINVNRAAGALAQCGLRKGDRLALQAEKSVEVLEIYAACLMTGVLFLPLNTGYTAEEIDYFLGDAEAGAFICSPSREAEFAPIAARHNTKLLTLSKSGSGSFSDIARACAPLETAVACGPDDIAALLYTSGTTGRSKGAMLTHANLLSNAEVLVDLWQITQSDRLLHALPVFHAHGLFVAVNTTWLSGSSMIFHPAFNIDNALAALPQASTMMGVPTFYTRLLDDARFGKEVVGNMRLFISGSAPLLAETHAQFEERSGHRILERYGMTETGMNTSNPVAGERRAGTVGHPLPGVTLRITDPATGAAVAQGDIGMIEVAGSNVFQGYWRMPEKTAEELRADGFLITGDLGRIDDEGYVHIVGRSKDLIISGGYNVYPKEVEMVIDDVHWVRESAVIGAPHPDFGEGVVAVVVLVAGAAADMVALTEVISTRLAKFKQPKKIIVTEALPRNTMGKVQKNVLRDLHRDLFARKA